MAYKLITIDVDDTLLTDDHRITEGTKAALAEAVSRGVVVTLATGRMFLSAKQIAKQLELNVPIITYQGSLVKTLLDEQVLYERSVPQPVAKRFYEYCQEHGLHLHVYNDDTLYVPNDGPKSRDYAALSNIPYTVEPDFSKLIELPLTKMLIIDEPAKLDALVPELQAMFGGEAHVTKSKPNFLEILHPEATKGHAVRFLADYYGCDLSEVISIGDSWNDKEMLEVAGLGVAMGNAIEPLKAVADYVTLTNNEEGVRHVVEKFVLNR